MHNQVDLESGNSGGGGERIVVVYSFPGGAGKQVASLSGTTGLWWRWFWQRILRKSAVWILVVE